MLIVYQVNSNGRFIGTITADPNPLEPGEWIIPAGAVLEAPPSREEDEDVVWTDGKWEIVPRLTQEPEEQKPKDAPLAEPREPFVIIDPEPDQDNQPTIIEPELTFSEKVTQELNTRFVAGCMVHLGEGRYVHISGDPATTRNIASLASIAGIQIRRDNLSSLVRYRDTFNNYWDLYPNEIEELYIESVQYASRLYAHSWQIKDMDPPPENLSDPGLWPSVEVGRPPEETHPETVDVYAPPVDNPEKD